MYTFAAFKNKYNAISKPIIRNNNNNSNDDNNNNYYCYYYNILLLLYTYMYKHVQSLILSSTRAAAAPDVLLCTYMLECM